MTETILAIAICIAVICTALSLIDRHLSRHALRDAARQNADCDTTPWGDVVVVPKEARRSHDIDLPQEFAQ